MLKPNFILDIWNPIKMPSLTTDFQKEILFEHVFLAPPGNFLEIGVYYGADLFVAAKTKQVIGQKADIIGIDIYDPANLYRHDPIWQTNGLDNPMAQVWKYAEDFGLTEGLRLIKGDSLELGKEKWPPLSVLVVDGNHDYKHAMADLENFGKFVVPGGFILVHDYYNHENEFFGVNEAVADYRPRHPEMTFYTLGQYAIFRRDK